MTFTRFSFVAIFAPLARALRRDEIVGSLWEPAPRIGSAPTISAATC
jgi:hypothetical protein